MEIPMVALLFVMSQFLVAGAITWLEMTRRGRGTMDWARNLQCWAIDIGASIAFLPFFSNFKGVALLDGHALPFLIAFPLFLLVRDLSEFVFHRFQHTVPFLWRMHSLHHSDPEMSALTTNRHFWGDQLFKAATIWPLTSVIISQSHAMVAGYAIVTLYNYFIHANLKISFGKWSWLLNNPAYHRLHHSRLPQDYGSNFAALFPIWDVLTGSYRAPDGWPPTGYTKAPDRAAELILWPIVNQQQSNEAPQTSA